MKKALRVVVTVKVDVALCLSAVGVIVLALLGR
jgi:hypothetical protein